MAHAYQSVNSFRENMKTTNHFFLLTVNCLSLDVFLKTVFFNLKPIHGGGDGGFLKYMSVILLN